jgi:hypothetical protein
MPQPRQEVTTIDAADRIGSLPRAMVAGSRGLAPLA